MIYMYVLPDTNILSAAYSTVATGVHQNIAKLNISAKLAIPVKVRPQSRTASDKSKFLAAIPPTIGWNCQYSICPSQGIRTTYYQ